MGSYKKQPPIHERKDETLMKNSKQVRILTVLMAIAVLLGCLTVAAIGAGATATVNDTIIEDFEDAAHVANWHQGVAGATMTQDTTVKHAGNASGKFENTYNNGLTGDGKNTNVVNFDLSGFEKIRLYIKNPGDADVALLFQIYLANYQSTGSMPHLAIINVPANTDFTAYEIVLADMVLKGTESTMDAQAKENWKILEYDLAPASPGLYTLYVDDITAVAPVAAEPTVPVDTVIEGFEDAALVSSNWYQNIVPAQAGTMTQDTSVKNSGNASGKFVTTTDYGLTGNSTSFTAVDLTGYEKLRVYFKNPGNTDVTVRMGLALADFLSTRRAYCADFTIRANSEFTAYEVAIADMKQLMNGQPTETTLAQSGESEAAFKGIFELSFTVASPGTYTLYVDDITIVAPATSAPSEEESSDVVSEEESSDVTSEEESSTVPVEEGMLPVWDMEDKALIDQLVTDPNIQTTEQKQSTEFKRGGSASLYWKNVKGNYGALGNLVAFNGKDMTGYDAIRFYVYNPGDYPVMVQCQIAVKAFGITAVYVTESEAPAVNGFVPVDFDLDKFELKAGSTAGAAKLLDNPEADALVIYDIGLVFNSRERDELYLDDAMLVTDEYAAKHENDEVVPVKPAQGTTGEEKPTEGEGSDSTTGSAEETTSTDAVESSDSPDTGVNAGATLLGLGLLACSFAGVWLTSRKKQK